MEAILNVAVVVESAHPDDSRVRGEVEALLACGHKVRVYAFVRYRGINGTPRIPKRLHGASAKPVFVDDDRLVPILSRLLSEWRRVTQRSAPRTNFGITIKNQVPDPIRRLRLRQVIGSLCWSHATFRALVDAIKDEIPDVIHAHDLSTLGASERASSRLGCYLIYDAHEYEADRNGVAGGLVENVRLRDERRFIGRANAVITVSDGIADRLVRDYGIPRPQVILNAFHRDSPETPNIRGKLGLGTEDRIAVLTGSLQPGRGHPEAIGSLVDAPDWHLAFLGRYSPARVLQLKGLAEALGVSHRVHWLGAVAPECVVSVTRAADAALLPIQNTSEAYRLALPNKLFQAIAAGVPLVVTPLPEIAGWTRWAGAGVVAKGFGAQDIAAALREAQETTLSASGDLRAYSSDAQRRRLCAVYKALGDGSPLPESTPLPHSLAKCATTVKSALL